MPNSILTGSSKSRIGRNAIEKHQYDVKKVAEQVDGEFLISIFSIFWDKIRIKIWTTPSLSRVKPGIIFDI